MFGRCEINQVRNSKNCTPVSCSCFRNFDLQIKSSLLQKSSEYRARFGRLSQLYRRISCYITLHCAAKKFSSLQSNALFTAYAIWYQIMTTNHKIRLFNILGPLEQGAPTLASSMGILCYILYLSIKSHDNSARESLRNVLVWSNACLFLRLCTLYRSIQL